MTIEGDGATLVGENCGGGEGVRNSGFGLVIDACVGVRRESSLVSTFYFGFGLKRNRCVRGQTGSRDSVMEK